MKNYPIVIKDKKIQKLLEKGGRLGAKQDFVELLKRAIFPDARRLR